ncbi:MAG: glycoside hydrolase family 5 protein [Promethearchaeota archaeon]
MYFQGLNIGGYFSQVEEFTEEHLNTFITVDDIEIIKEWGFNVVRLPVDYFFFEKDETPYRYLEDRLKLIDKVVKWTHKKDIVLILDLHKAPGHTFDIRESENNDLWDKDSENRERFLKIWEMFSKRYQKSNNIMYDIMNEPLASEDSDWYELVEETIPIIRKNDQNKYIIVESNLWGQTSTFKSMRKFTDEKISYSFHFYEPHVITHQMAEWVPFVYNNIYRKYLKYPGRPEGLTSVKEEVAKISPQFALFFERQDIEWNKSELEKAITPVLAFKKKHNVPILCGEFGCVAKADPETRKNWLTDVISIFQKHQISYTYWSYKNMDFGIYDFTEKYQNNPNYSKEERLDNATLSALQAGIPA